MDNLQKILIDSPYGTLAAFSTSSTDNPVSMLMIHGNSTSSNVFRHVFASPLAKAYRLIAFDLPGHGASSDAHDPESTYTQKAYASAALHVLRHLGVAQVVVFGWSLGGHIGLEMIPPSNTAGVTLRGLMIVGSPPIPLGDPDAGFYGSGVELPAFRADLSNDELEAFSRTTTGPPLEPWMRENAFRTHGLARSTMFAAMNSGADSDQQKLVASTAAVPLAVINGADEPYIRIDYIRGLRYANLWRNTCFELPGLHHAPFWEDPDTFYSYLRDFLHDCSAE